MLFGKNRQKRKGLERETGIEPAAICLGSKCSATELVPLATDDRTDVNQSPPHLLIIRACPQIGQHLLDLVVSHGTIV